MYYAIDTLENGIFYVLSYWRHCQCSWCCLELSFMSCKTRNLFNMQNYTQKISKQNPFPRNRLAQYISFSTKISIRKKRYNDDYIWIFIDVTDGKFMSAFLWFFDLVHFVALYLSFSIGWHLLNHWIISYYTKKEKNRDLINIWLEEHLFLFSLCTE